MRTPPQIRRRNLRIPPSLPRHREHNIPLRFLGNVEHYCGWVVLLFVLEAAVGYGDCGLPDSLLPGIGDAVVGEAVTAVIMMLRRKGGG